MAHIGEKGGLGGVCGFASNRLRNASSRASSSSRARSSTSNRNLRIFVETIGDAACIDEQQCGTERQQGRQSDIEAGAAGKKPNGRQNNNRHQAADAACRDDWRG